MLFTLFSAQFLMHFLSNGGDRGLRVRIITAAAVRLWCLLVCLLVTSWPPLCDESTALRVDRITSWPVTSWPCDESTGWRVDWQPIFGSHFRGGGGRVNPGKGNIPVTILIWYFYRIFNTQLTIKSNQVSVLLYKKESENFQKHLLPGTRTAVP